jgi:hypothetical protein
MAHKLVLLLLILAATVSSAQQAGSKPPDSLQPASPVDVLPRDPAKLAMLISASYYRPDELSSIDCNISMDWAALFTALKQTPPADRLALLQALKIHSHAARGKETEITFDWAGGPVDGKEQIESGLKQTVSGFYQMYWPLLATALFKDAAELGRVEPLPDGSVKVYTVSEGNSLVVTVDKSGQPVHWVLDSAAMKGTIDPHFTPSPNPRLGDLSRISSLNVVEQIGTSSMNVKLDMDYQPVDKFFLPRKVSFGIVGAYSLKMEFIGCTVSHSSPAL